VKELQAVARGQKIAELGASDADRPKLHFQIRKGSAAVDPLRYLPGS
jgi:lipoprotein NlpD